MKLFIFLTLFSLNAFAVCDTVISRTNSSPNTVLTSTKYNLDLNTVYSRVNELPGDCVTAGTLPATALTESEFAPLFEGIKEGCFATRSDANTISIDKCIISVSGNLIKKTTATTVTWGCSGCSSEVSGTTYYVYATDATSLTLKISTTAPDAFGYNGAERALARFYNNASSDIDTYSVDQWIVSRFEPQKVASVSYTPTGTWLVNTTYAGKIRRIGGFAEIALLWSTSGAPTSATLSINLPTGLVIDTARLPRGSSAQMLFGHGDIFDAAPARFSAFAFFNGSSTTSVDMYPEGSGGTYGNYNGPVNQIVPMTWAAGDSGQVTFLVPIVGWND